MAQPLSIIARKPARITICRDAEDQKFLIKMIFIMTFDQPCTIYYYIIYNKIFMNN